MTTNQITWKFNGKAFFAAFVAGRSVIGEMIVGQIGDQWISGAKCLGAQPFAQGYYELKGTAPKFDTREAAQAEAMRLAQVCVDKDFEMKQYLFDLDKKSPWKNTPQPIKETLKFQ